MTRQPSQNVTVFRLHCARRGYLPLQTKVKRPIKLLFLPENIISVPDSVLFGHSALGVGAGIWERTKGLLNHHIAAATDRDTPLFPSE